MTVNMKRWPVGLPNRDHSVIGGVPATFPHSKWVGNLAR